MNITFTIVTETLRAVLYLTLFMDVSSRMMFWFGAENTLTGSFLRLVSDMISAPFRRLLSRAVARHPSVDMIPGILGTAVIAAIAFSIP
ncbi:MAG: hypothetical protein IJY04_03095 [Clostridia bacterium]|nr:hypothetical protein [Clostridia bacterium]